MIDTNVGFYYYSHLVLLYCRQFCRNNLLLKEVIQLIVSEVKLKKGENIDRALRRLKKKMDREGLMREIRAHRHFEKPSERKRRKAARARVRQIRGY